MSKTEIMDLLEKLSRSDRIWLAQTILGQVMEVANKTEVDHKKERLLSMVGRFDEAEANHFKNALAESRQIEVKGW